MARGSAVIVGGGIGGLTAALALHRHGWRVRVLEQAPEFGEVGAGITLWSNALNALDALGIGDKLRALGGPIPGSEIRDPRGKVLMRANTARITQRLGRPVVLHRAELHRALLEELPADLLHTGRSVHEIREHGQRVLIRHGEREHEADLVVGADGIRSVVRERLWPGSRPPRYSGLTAWRAQVELPGVHLRGSETWGPGTQVGVVPMSKDRVYYYATAKLPAGGAGPHGELPELYRRFGHWHEPIPTLLSATSEDAVLRHDLYRLPPLTSFVTGRVALLGDAAHAMMPNLGQGACQAIEDAVVLGRVLGDPADVPGALLRYDRARRKRTQQIARGATGMARIGTLSRRPAIAVRDLGMRLTPAGAGVRSLRGVIDWRPE